MRNCPTNFLFDWEKESRRKDKRDEPHRDDWLEAVLAKCLLPDLEKDVCGNTGDKQADTNRDGAFGQCNF